MNEKVQELLENVQRTASCVSDVAVDAAYGVGKKAGELLSVAKLNIRLVDLRSEVNLQLREVGEMVYATHTGDPTDSDTMQTALEAVDALKEQIAQKERELQSIRGVTVCTACGCANPVDHVYCSNCGQPLER